MKLKDKGPIVKPPDLKGWAQKASLEIQSWKDIVSATHWEIGDSTKVNGADFYVAEDELGHIHLDGEIHVKLTKPLRESLVTAKLAQPFRWGADWVQLKIKDKPSMESALWIFRIGYDRLKGEETTQLKRRISEFSKAR